MVDGYTDSVEKAHTICLRLNKLSIKCYPWPYESSGVEKSSPEIIANLQSGSDNVMYIAYVQNEKCTQFLVAAMLPL